jgi:hypothetical protein
MGFLKGFTATILLNDPITKQKKENCISILAEEGFLGYNYESETYVDFNEVLLKYPNRPRYSSKYNKENFVISCSEQQKHLGCTIDANNNDAEIIIKVTDKFSEIFDEINFSYIDNLGDTPNDFYHDVEKKEVRWLFKYNYFGKSFIEKYGKDFFVKMPCVKKEFITKDIIRIDFTENISSPIEESLAKEVLNYLKTYSINPVFYNYKKFLID